MIKRDTADVQKLIRRGKSGFNLGIVLIFKNQVNCLILMV